MSEKILGCMPNFVALIISFLLLVYILCCRCDAKIFHLSKSHKKILKKMNNFLRTGQKGNGASSSNNTNNTNTTHDNDAEHDDCDIKMRNNEQRMDADESSALTETKMITSNQPKVAIDIANVLEVIENADNSSSSSSSINNTVSGSAIQNMMAPCQTGETVTINCFAKKMNHEAYKRGAVAGPDPTKPLQPKAKVLRQQRKAEKLLAKTNSINSLISNENNVSEVDLMKKPSKNEEKSLKSFIDEMSTDGMHKLKVNSNLPTFYHRKLFFCFFKPIFFSNILLFF